MKTIERVYPWNGVSACGMEGPGNLRTPRLAGALGDEFRLGEITSAGKVQVDALNQALIPERQEIGLGLQFLPLDDQNPAQQAETGIQ